MPDPHRGSPSGPPLGADREIAFRKPRNWFQKHLSGIIAVAVVIVLVGGITIAFLATRNLDDVAASDPSAGVSSSAPPSSAKPTTPAPATTSKPPTPTGTAVKNATGKVVAVLAVGRWTLQLEGGVTVTVATNSATKYKGNKDANDVKKNTSITISGSMAAGIITASTVTINKKSS